jgi:acetyl-CoA carboxylase biotin carboxyl carrier protein
MTADEIRELIQLAVDTGIAELEVQRGENRVRIRRGWPGGQEILLPASTTAPPPGWTTPPVPAPAAFEAPHGPAQKAPDDLVLVKSPIVGTFYEGPSPGAPPFVQPGERIQPGKVLCIIESMKLMNEIEAEIGGIVENKLVENGQPVEYGEALFAIRPV